MLRPTIKGKARRREGDAAGKENAFRDRDFICFSSKTKKVEDGLRCVLSEGNTLFRPRWYDCRALSSFACWPIGIAAFGLCQPLFSNKEFRLGRESAGNNKK
ncbi:nadh-ubiquinone oxidoreductase chain 2 [Quercus suber]|uniref:Nadh-ubiquinone oxidoreductase chain 2 n=1 Tax=Quercus suber TaxID=58331 RepID=A0AAW0KGN5_QUESU